MRLTNETSINNAGMQSESFEDLRPLVGLQRRDPHLRHDLENTVVRRVHVVLDDLILRHSILEKAFSSKLEHRLEAEVRTDSIRSVSDEYADVMNLPRFSSFCRRNEISIWIKTNRCRVLTDEEGDLGSLLVANEMVVDSSGSDEGGEGNSIGGDVSVGEDNDANVVGDGLTSFGTDSVESSLITCERNR